mmetsp:Transcript_117972/g.251969  ORF Transcript_117972/g.251969 Transcript_117972/m.251969 type:complete len:277 (-) Transcript_117972:68-898(-)
MDIDSSQIRKTLGDTEGVTHLKEVMRNIHRLYSECTSPQAKAEGWGLSQNDDPRYAQPESEKKVEKPKKKEDAASYDLAQLGSTVEDGICADLLGDEQQGSVLRSCGSRISGLCSRLQTLESQVPHAPRAYASDPSTDIRIVDRPEEAASVQRARADRAAAEDITKHAKWPPLDILDETINKSQNFEQLRTHFPQHHQKHPRLVFLTDYALTDREVLMEAIREGNGHVGERRSTRSGSATQLRGTTGTVKQVLQIPGQPARKTRFRRDHSAPSLRQ